MSGPRGGLLQRDVDQAVTVNFSYNLRLTNFGKRAKKMGLQNTCRCDICKSKLVK